MVRSTDHKAPGTDHPTLYSAKQRNAHSVQIRMCHRSNLHGRGGKSFYLFAGLKLYCYDLLCPAAFSHASRSLQAGNRDITSSKALPSITYDHKCPPPVPFRARSKLSNSLQSFQRSKWFRVVIASPVTAVINTSSSSSSYPPPPGQCQSQTSVAL